MKKMMLFVVLLMSWATVAGQPHFDLSSVEQNLENVLEEAATNLEKNIEPFLQQAEANLEEARQQIEANLKKGSKEPFAVYKFPAKTIEKVTVQTAGGSIRVTGDATGAIEEATVEVWISPNGSNKELSKEEIQKILDEYYTLEIAAEHGELRAKAERNVKLKTWTDKNSVGISFHLTVPQKVASQLSTSGGSIHLRNLSGEEVLSTAGGSLHLEEVSGTVTGRTSGGSIHLSESKGEITLSTAGGSIHAKNNQGNIQLKTSGGSLHIDNVSGTVTAATSGGSIRLSDLTGTIQAKTSGGSVQAKYVNGTLSTSTSGGSMRLSDISGNLEARTTGGSMSVQMRSVARYVRLSNSGNISLTLPDGKGYNLQLRSNKIETAAIKNFQGVFESRNINGTLNGGGAEIDVKSSQRVTLTFE
jgi:hypothetical protein